VTWRSIGRNALVGATVLLILVSFLPLWWTDRWWVRMWDFPRLQVAVLLLAVAIGLWFMKLGRWRWPLLGASIAALVWQGSHFIAYFPPWPKQVASSDACPAGRQISLLNANVLLTNEQYAALLDLVERRRPDVLLMLEPGTEWAKAAAALHARYPYRLSEPLPNTYGLILLSRLPMRGRIEHLLQPGVPSAHVQLRLPGGEDGAPGGAARHRVVVALHREGLAAAPLDRADVPRRCAVSPAVQLCLAAECAVHQSHLDGGEEKLRTQGIQALELDAADHSGARQVCYLGPR